VSQLAGLGKIAALANGIRSHSRIDGIPSDDEIHFSEQRLD
jgi:hypothetical protein